MRLLRFSGTTIAPLGLAAALVAHEILRAFAALRLGAPSFATHEHKALAPTACVEIVLVLWALGMAVKDAIADRGLPCYRQESLALPSGARLLCCAGAIALFAVATLFGMEFSESGSAALGLGWLGGTLLPGVIVLALAVLAAAGLLYFTLAGRIAGFERLVALFAAALAHPLAVRRSASSFRRTHAARPLAMRVTPCARHAGLRAPPVAIN